MSFRRFILTLLVAAIPPTAPGCDAEPLEPAPVEVATPAPAAAVPASRPHALDRVVVVGASVSAGFGAEVEIDEGDRWRSVLIDLADVLDAAIVREESTVTGFGNAFFFTAPMPIGRRLMERARAERPTLLVAVDFLFWFAYGVNGPDGEPFEREDDRRALLDEGLAMLDEATCPVLLGDLPDMTPAIGFMLGARQVPSPPSLASLNERLRSWARERPHVVVIPVAETIGRIQRDEAIELGPHRWPAGSAAELVQYDQLHPTTRGLIVTAQLVADVIADSELADAEDFDLDPDRVLERMRRAAARPEGAPDEPLVPADV